jgi:excinuclease UvrABC nuclease subunit
VTHTVYLLIGDNDKPIYIGKSTSITSRVASHRRDRAQHEALGGRTKWQATRRVEVVECADRDEMNATERRLIAAHRPVLNKLDNPDDAYHPVSVDAWVEKTLGAAPELTDKQRNDLAELLRPVRVTGAGAAVAAEPEAS